MHDNARSFVLCFKQPLSLSLCHETRSSHSLLRMEEILPSRNGKFLFDSHSPAIRSSSSSTSLIYQCIYLIPSLLAYETPNWIITHSLTSHSSCTIIASSSSHFL
ncbi:hypothetical protein BDR06DRAFT_959017 [Suillus hirtellus]|nr:hypothetical protein BDR06DRAFT_959017 [Suillus hirtellus]